MVVKMVVKTLQVPHSDGDPVLGKTQSGGGANAVRGTCQDRHAGTPDAHDNCCADAAPSFQLRPTPHAPVRMASVPGAVAGHGPVAPARPA
jgi:hypothetical protein